MRTTPSQSDWKSKEATTMQCPKCGAEMREKIGAVPGMPKLATMQRSQKYEANRQFDANEAETTESRAASHMARDNQTRISTKPTTTLSVERKRPVKCIFKISRGVRMMGPVTDLSPETAHGPHVPRNLLVRHPGRFPPLRADPRRVLPPPPHLPALLPQVALPPPARTAAQTHSDLPTDLCRPRSSDDDHHTPLPAGPCPRPRTHPGQRPRRHFLFHGASGTGPPLRLSHPGSSRLRSPLSPTAPGLPRRRALLMLSLPSTVRIYLCSQPADMRRAFDGLAAMTQQVIGQNPLSGHLFVFVNRRRDRLKILYWDRDGYALWAKRLERGTSRFPEPKGNSLEVTPSELAAILGGIDLNTARRQRRFTLPAATATV